MGFKFVKRVWQEPDRFSVIAVKTDIDTGSKGGTTTTHSDPRNDTFSERDAMLKLDQLRAMLAKGKKAEAKKGLEDLIRKFPKSDVADEARDLLDEIK